MEERLTDREDNAILSIEKERQTGNGSSLEYCYSNPSEAKQAGYFFI